MIVQWFFREFFLSFGPCIESFKYCRPLITVDGTYLYRQYDEKLLIAVAFDANNEIFSLTFAIVNEENNDNWRSFFLCLQIYVIGGRICICIIWDRYISIKNEVAEIWRQPLRYHQCCTRYFISNLNHKFKDPTTKKDLIKMYYKHFIYKFDLWCERICNMNLLYREWLERELK